MYSEPRALLINTHAGKLRSRAEGLQGRYNDNGFDVWISHSEEEGETLLDMMQEYPLAVVGGGDDTARFVLEGLHRRNGDGAPPLVAALALGTGNGVATALGAGLPEEDLALLASRPVTSLPFQEIPLIRVQAYDLRGKPREPHHCTFAGTGLDALIQGHYERIGAQMGVRGMAGYALSIARTLPQLPFSFPYAAVHSSQVRLIEEERGKREDTPPLVFSQENFHSVTVGTTEYFGFRFKPLVYAGEARRESKMHVKMGKGNAALSGMRLLNQVHPLWTGQLRDGNLFTEGMTDQVTVTSQDFPIDLQISGRYYGKVSRVEYGIEGRVRLVDFRELRKEK